MKKKLVCCGAGTLVLALGLGVAQAGSYNSPLLLHDFAGSTCFTCAEPDGDTTYQEFINQTGWQLFGASAHPLPGFLAAIDPAFAAHYRVDSLTFKVKQTGGAHSSSETWYFDMGDGLHADAPFESLLLVGGIVQTLTIGPDSPVFQAALADADGALEFRLRETTTGNDRISLYNAAVIVNFSDRLLVGDPVPEPGTLLLLAAGLIGAGALRTRALDRR